MLRSFSAFASCCFSWARSASALANSRAAWEASSRPATFAAAAPASWPFAWSAVEPGILGTSAVAEVTVSGLAGFRLSSVMTFFGSFAAFFFSSRARRAASATESCRPEGCCARVGRAARAKTKNEKKRYGVTRRKAAVVIILSQEDQLKGYARDDGPATDLVQARRID